MEKLTDEQLAEGIRNFTNPERHDELIAHGWTTRMGIWQPHYQCPITGVHLIQDSAWQAHQAMKAYGQKEGV